MSLSKGSIQRRFNVKHHLDHLKGEYELMAQEIESLRKERDNFKVKVEEQAREIKDVRRNFACGQCRKGADTSVPRSAASSQLNARIQPRRVPQSSPLERLSQSVTPRRLDCRKGADTSVPQSAASSQLNARVQPRRVPQSSPLERPSQSGTPRRLDQSLKTTRRSTQRTTPIRSDSTPAQAKHIIVPHSQIVSPPSLALDLSVPNVGPGPPKECNSPIVFNNEVERELDVQMVHALFHGHVIECVNFSRDGKYLAVGCTDGKAYIYNVMTGTLKCVLRNLLTERDRIGMVCFNHDGNHLATVSSDGNVYIWEIKTKRVRNAFKGFVHSLDFSPNGKLLVSALSNNTVKLWNMRYGSAKVLTDASRDALSSSYYTSAVFSPGGTYVAASYFHGIVRIWNLATHVGYVFDVAFMPDGNGLVSGCDETLKYWDISSLHVSTMNQQTPERLFTGIGHSNCVYSISISPDGRWLASSPACGSAICILDTRNAAVQCTLNHKNWVNTIDFSPTGNFLAFGDCSGVVQIWRYSESTTRGS